MNRENQSGQAYKFSEKKVKNCTVLEPWGSRSSFEKFSDQVGLPAWLTEPPGYSRPPCPYYDIEVETILAGPASAPDFLGIFVPSKSNKRAVLRALRKRFGKNTFFKLS